MAIKTFYLLNSTAVTPNFFGNMQDGGTAPSAANSAFGWTIGKTSTGYWKAAIGATALATTESATSYIASATGPTKGTGTSGTTAGDSFASPVAYNGTFAAGNWTLAFGMRCGTATAQGAMRCRVWASVNASGASARELTSGAQAGSAVTLSATGTTYTSTITWNAPAITLNNEYLFFQLEWQNTSAGSSPNSSVLFYQSAATVTTTNFAAIDLLAGNLQPTVTFSAYLGSPVAIAGGIAPTVAFSGVIGSPYGKGLYGKSLYSQVPAPTGGPQDLAGGIAPTVTFSGQMTGVQALSGGIAPVVTFSASLDYAGQAALQGDLAPQIAFSAYLGTPVLFAGGIAPAVSFAGAAAVTAGLAGGIAPVVSLGGALTVTSPVFDELAGDLQPTVVFSGAASLTEALSGGIAPVVSFGADLTIIPAVDLAGDLPPLISFAANLSLDVILAGDLAPQAAFSASLGLDMPIEGDLPLEVALGGSELTSGPLWAPEPPCPPPMWAEDECLGDPWIDAPPGAVYQPRSYGAGAYGAKLYSHGVYGAAPPPPWGQTSPCPDPGWVADTGMVYQGSLYGANAFSAKLYSHGGYVSAVSPWRRSELCNG